jgi:hypothetical protein
LSGAGLGQSWHDDRVQGNSVKVLFDEEGSASYPMTEEWDALSKKNIPNDLQFYYVESCFDSECIKKSSTMYFWRGMTSNDLIRYDSRLEQMNKLIAVSPIEISGGNEKLSNDYIEFLKRISADGLPNDFIIMTLAKLRATETCADTATWWFDFRPRDMALAIAQITNLSKEPLIFDGLFGGENSIAGLHDITTQVPENSSELIELDAQTLQPKESVAVPLRIEFPAPDALLDKEQIQVSNSLYGKLGTNGFKGSSNAYRTPPKQRDYALGPETLLTGVRINGQRVDFERRSANFVEVIASTEAGSCPYLLSWSEPHTDWIDHRKILHDARGQNREAIDIAEFQGFRSRFRIEEREPELAHLNKVELVVLLRNGSRLQLQANHLALKSQDRHYFHAYWGDAIDIEFKLPEGITKDYVASSTLIVTGFYQRYSELLPVSISPHFATVKASLRGSANMCPQ